MRYKVEQGTTTMYLRPTNDFRIKRILQDENLDMLKTTCYCGSMFVKVVDTKQTSKFCKNLISVR